VPTDISAAIDRKVKAKREKDYDVAAASAWLIIYLLLVIGTLHEPILARAVETSGLY